MIIHSKFLFNSVYKKQIDFYEETIEYEVQALYCSAVDHIGFNKLKCNKCNEIGNFVIKGYYYRTIIINNKAIRIRITRIKCKDCNKTHAILFLDFVPYYQLSTVNCRKLILVNFIDINYDELIIERLKKRVMIFETRLKDISKSVYINTIEEITMKYSEYRRQSYLQIHRGVVLIYSSS